MLAKDKKDALTMTQSNSQYVYSAGSAYGHCHRCGAPKAPMFVGPGQMILCTRCTSVEDQKACLEFIEMAKRLCPSGEITKP